MQQQVREQLEWATAAEPALEASSVEKTALVKVLTDFLQGASRYILEDDPETSCA